MTQYNSVNVKLSDPQLRLKSLANNNTGVTLRVTANVFGLMNPNFHLNYH